MALPKLTKEMNIIAALDDSPALSASELKAKFDEGNKALKDFLNETFIPEVEKGKQNTILVCQGEPFGGEDGDIILVYKG